MQNHTQPKISVVVPVYNAANYLAQCLESILSQSLKEFEVIVIDDGSTDDSLLILRKFQQNDNRITIYCQDHKYAGAARNLGIKNCRGKYLLFLDSDDFFEKDMFQSLYDLAEKDDSDVVICNFEKFDATTGKDVGKYCIREQYINISPFSPTQIPNKLFQIINPAPWNKLFRASVVKDHHINFENTISANDVTFVYTMLALAKKISIVDHTFVHYRTNQTGNISAKRKKSIDCILHAMNQLKANLVKLGLFNKYSESFYKRVQISAEYELSYLTYAERLKFLVRAKSKTSPDIYNKSLFLLLCPSNNSLVRRVLVRLTGYLARYS